MTTSSAMSTPERRHNPPVGRDVAIGVVGATGAVGPVTLDLLRERGYENVRAFASARSAGKQLGDSARAALTTRAFGELTRFGKALGGRPETLTGLSGLGDLLLTCSSKQSRNYSLGLALGQGKGLTQALAEAKGTVEGIATANIVARLAVEQNIEMPISGAVHAVVDGGSNPEEEIARLLARPVNPEFHRG